MTPSKTVLILGANSDVAKEATLLYLRKGYHVIAASRSTADISSFMEARKAPVNQLTVLHFEVAAF